MTGESSLENGISKATGAQPIGIRSGQAMRYHRFPLILEVLTFFVLICALGLPSAAQASGKEEASFDAFVGGGMKGLKKDAEIQGNQARFLRPAASGPAKSHTVVRYGPDVSKKLKETGDPKLPFVGILTYTEETWVCQNEGEVECTFMESSPVTEIFPFRDGRWRY